MTFWPLLLKETVTSVGQRWPMRIGSSLVTETEMCMHLALLNYQLMYNFFIVGCFYKVFIIIWTKPLNSAVKVYMVLFLLAWLAGSNRAKQTSHIHHPAWYGAGEWHMKQAFPDCNALTKKTQCWHEVRFTQYGFSSLVKLMHTF